MTIIGYLIEYFGLILSVFLILLILAKKKEARATLAWIIFIIFLPYLGAFVYLIFGNPRLKIIQKKVTKPQKIFYEKKYGATEEYENCSIGKEIERTAGVMPSLCEDVKFINIALFKYSRLSEDILNAKEYILIEYYIFRFDDTGKYFIELLNKKLKQGVKVFFLYDGMGSMGLSLRIFMKEFKSLGGRAEAFLSPFDVRFFARMNFRNHRKLVVVDGEICYLGGMNIGNEYSGDDVSGIDWVDGHVRFKGEAVVPALEVFVDDWFFTTGEDLTHCLKRPSENIKGDTSVHIIPSGPYKNLSKMYVSFFSMVSGAKKNINIVTPYLVPDEPVMELLKFASLKGLNVSIILPGVNNHPFVAAAGRSYYEELTKCGVKIYEIKDKMLHAKIITIDDSVCFIGSSNMDNRSFKINFELNAVFYSGDFTFEVNEFIAGCLKNSILITEEMLKNKKFHKKLYEGICRTLSPVL